MSNFELKENENKMLEKIEYLQENIQKKNEVIASQQQELQDKESDYMSNQTSNNEELLQYKIELFFNYGFYFYFL